MEFISLKKTKDGKYLKNYELTYLNKAGHEKTYEIVSRSHLADVNDLGAHPSGVSIVATMGQTFLLLKEFRMGVNKEIYNLCAGMIEDGETIEECIQRELYEETGLSVKKIKTILPPSYSAVAISDISTYFAFVEAEGSISSGHVSDNEQITANFYTADALMKLLSDGAPFSSRAQLAAFSFCHGFTF